MSPGGLKQYILNNGWERARDGDQLYQSYVGIWNGATWQELKAEGYCPYDPTESDGEPGGSKARLRRQDPNTGYNG